jgi:hypothetical protein
MDHSKPPCDLLTGFTNSPVRDFHSLEYSAAFATFTHAGRTQHLAAMAGDEQVESFLLSIIFVAGDCFVAVNPPLTASCKQLWPIKTLKEGEL